MKIKNILIYIRAKQHNQTYNMSLDIKELLIGIDDDIRKKELTIKNSKKGKKNTNIVSIFDISDAYKFKLYLNPKSLERKIYITLDTFNYRIKNQTSITWDFSTAGDQSQLGTVFAKGVVSNIKAIKLYQISLPTQPSSSVLYNSFISILISELKSQSVVGFPNRNYHFLLKPNLNPSNLTRINPYWREYTPIGGGELVFSKPITELSTLTLSIANPMVVIPFPQDNVYLDNSNFSQTSPTTITLTPLISFNNGDRVVISGFNTVDPITDQAQINSINSPNGHIITITSTTTFTIDVDLSTISSPTGSCEIVDVSSRIYFPLEITYIYTGEEQN